MFGESEKKYEDKIKQIQNKYEKYFEKIENNFNMQYIEIFENLQQARNNYKITVSNININKIALNKAEKNNDIEKINELNKNILANITRKENYEIIIVESERALKECIKSLEESIEQLNIKIKQELVIKKQGIWSKITLFINKITGKVNFEKNVLNELSKEIHIMNESVNIIIQNVQVGTLQYISKVKMATKITNREFKKAIMATA